MLIETQHLRLQHFNQQSKNQQSTISYRRHGERSGQWLIASSAQAVDLPA
jgi:hypothetical protein